MQTSKRGIIVIIACCLVVLVSYEYYQNKNVLESRRLSIKKESSVKVDRRVADANSLYVDQEKSINGLTVRLNAFFNDTRCPLQEKCATKGEVLFNVTLRDGTTTVTRILSSKGNPELLNAYTIAVTKVLPEREAAKGIEKEAYIVTFDVKMK